MQPRRYTAAQRDAMAAAFEQPHVSARDVVATAAAGLLMHPSGARLDPFLTTPSTVRALTARTRQRREREAARAKASELPARDGLERLRCQLSDAAEAELRRIGIEQAHGRPASWESLRQAARALRELAWIPGPDERRPPPPGAKLNGSRQGGETHGGLAGRILRASQQHANGVT